MIANKGYKKIEIPVSKKSYRKTELKNNINVNLFGFENKSRDFIKI